MVGNLEICSVAQCTKKIEIKYINSQFVWNAKVLATLILALLKLFVIQIVFKYGKIEIGKWFFEGRDIKLKMNNKK